MNTKRLLVVAGLAAAGLAGCASTQPQLARVPSAAVERQHGFGARESYMMRVEQVARERGLDVRWVNPPDARVAKQ